MKYPVYMGNLSEKNFLCGDIIMYSTFKHLKALGQHFLKSDETAMRIVQSLSSSDTTAILEIGPGLGILTKHLLQLKGKSIFISELDTRIIEIMKAENFDPGKILEGDFLQIDLESRMPDQYMVIGNFPYNISSQILFRVVEQKKHIPLLVGMFQKEMAKRVTSKHGNKEYGVISVLVQAYYNTEYLFELLPDEFDPPPMVNSAVIRLIKKQSPPDCDEQMLRMVVKTAFNQRRKKLSNALSSVNGAKEALLELKFEHLRAEQLSIDDFIALSQTISGKKASDIN